MSYAPKYSHQSFAGMNSVLDMILIDIPDKTAADIGQGIRQDMRLLEQLLNRFDPRSETYAINNQAQNGWVKVSDELWRIVLDCEKFNELTLGYFDIALGYFKKNAGTNNHNRIRCMEEDSKPGIKYGMESKQLKFTNGSTSLDFGAIGKGLLLGKLQARLCEFGIENCFVSFGGSSILTRGKHPSGGAWPVSFRNESDHPFVFNLNDHAVSISGAIQGNNHEHHIINPHRLTFQVNRRLVFVQDECPIRAEVLSTALIAATKDDFSTLTTRMNPQKVYVFNQLKTDELTIEYEYKK